eukprot:gene11590-7985_t
MEEGEGGTQRQKMETWDENQTKHCKREREQENEKGFVKKVLYIYIILFAVLACEGKRSVVSALSLPVLFIGCKVLASVIPEERRGGAFVVSGILLHPISKTKKQTNKKTNKHLYMIIILFFLRVRGPKRKEMERKEMDTSRWLNCDAVLMTTLDFLFFIYGSARFN